VNTGSGHRPIIVAECDDRIASSPFWEGTPQAALGCRTSDAASRPRDYYIRSSGLIAARRSHASEDRQLREPCNPTKRDRVHSSANREVGGNSRRDAFSFEKFRLSRQS
jgi:hypothetical protein